MHLSHLAPAGFAATKSDKNAKKNKRPALGILEALKEIPVEEWEYKDGEGPPGRHIGPYAQDFKKVTGKGDGKTIFVPDIVGMVMGGVKELDEKVDKIAEKLELDVLPDRPAGRRKGRGVVDALEANDKEKGSRAHIPDDGLGVLRRRCGFSWRRTSESQVCKTGSGIATRLRCIAWRGLIAPRRFCNPG